MTAVEEIDQRLLLTSFCGFLVPDTARALCGAGLLAAGAGVVFVSWKFQNMSTSSSGREPAAAGFACAGTAGVGLDSATRSGDGLYVGTPVLAAPVLVVAGPETGV